MDITVQKESLNADQTLISTNKTFEATSITNFYSGKSIFITGGTGFLGMVLIGKLLTTCPVKRVYVLIKAKDGMSVQERLAELIKSPVFDDVRNYPSVLDCLIPMSGDIREKQLGMCENDVATLCSEVQIVIHSAASVHMNMDINEALEINTKSTAEVVRLCQGMHQLKVFLYVSTAYSNCQRLLIDERVYETSASVEAIYSIFGDLKKGKITDSRRNYLMENRPNTYTFSKSLAEKIVQEGFHGIPSVIVRPSIILSSLNFPEPGWTSSWSAPNRLLQAIAGGYLRCFFADADCPLDLVPVDQVANLLISSVWDADKHQHDKFTDACLKRAAVALALAPSVPRCSEIFGCPKLNSRTALLTRFLVIVKYRSVFLIVWLFLQTIPAYILDILSLLMFRKPKMTKVNASLRRAMQVGKYFVFSDITFVDHNTRDLLRQLGPRDQVLFDFDFDAIDWEKYLETNVLGLQKYLIKN